jgi:CBS-domain-containing membrane protein
MSASLSRPRLSAAAHATGALPLIFLVPPFAATLTILVYLPNTPVARPIAVVCGSVLGAAIGTVLSLFSGTGAGVATLAAVTTMALLALFRVFHPPGVALAMCPALLHLGPFFQWRSRCHSRW